MRAFAAILVVLAHGNPGVLEQEFHHVRLAEAAPAQSLRMFRTDHDQRLRPPADPVAPQVGQHRAKGSQQDFGRPRLVLADGSRRFGAVQRRRVRAARDAEVLAERAPRARFFVLADHEAEPTGIPHRGHIDAAWRGTADVAQDQLQCPADRRIRASGIREDVAPAGEAEFVAHGTVDDDQRSREVGRALDPVDIQSLVAQRSHERHEHAHVLGPASCHDTVRRDLLHGGLAIVGRHVRNDLARSHADGLQGPLDAFCSGRDHRQRVGES